MQLALTSGTFGKSVQKSLLFYYSNTYRQEIFSVMKRKYSKTLGAGDNDNGKR